METPARKAFPSDVTDDDRAFASPDLLMSKAALQREPALRDVFNGLRWSTRMGGSMA
jgi:hypothetical protein